MKKIFTFFVFLLAVLTITAQVRITKKDFYKDCSLNCKKAWKNIKKAETYFNFHSKGGYRQAIDFYLQAYDSNPRNLALNYKIGYCYIQVNFAQKALPYLQKVYDSLPDFTPDLAYLLARAYHGSGKFKKAIELYNIALEKTQGNNELFNQINKRIEECENGLELQKKARIISIQNLSDVNSIYDDYSPVVDRSDENMLFTSRRPVEVKSIITFDDLNLEKIFSSKRIKNQWQPPVFETRLNETYHNNSVVNIASDGRYILLVIDGILFYAMKNAGIWTLPQPLPHTINSGGFISSACISPDKSTIYFTKATSKDLDKPNFDIFYSKKDNKGNWSKPVRLPDNINTPYDENGVFLFDDGKTLYFSSKGHNTIGGYDIFKTVKINDSTWSDPENLGIPINSPNDDIFFTIMPNNVTAYYATITDSATIATKGGMDIYRINFIDNILFQDTQDQLIASVAEPVKETTLSSAVLLLKGVIKDENGRPVPARIIIKDVNTGKIVYTTSADPSTGSYVVTLPTGKNYAMTISKDGYMFHSENYNLIDEHSYKEKNSDIVLKKIEVNRTVTLKNIFFDLGSDRIRPSSYAELDEVVKFMKENPGIKVEIAGHTDNIGSREFNLSLSQKRAENVANYLISKGISRDRIVAKGYGFDKPIASNDTEEGRAKNRRVEFKIISQ